LQPTVLIAVLNWGLGHATRSIPVINQLLNQNYNVHIASDGDALVFLKKEYPDLVFHKLPSYNIRYSHSSILINILKSSFSIFNAIYKENVALRKIANEIKPKLIISDNRYGFYSKKYKSIIITHQINLYHRIALLGRIGSLFVKYYLNKFDEVWIPDFKGEKSLGGTLSLAPKSSKFKYIGPLSRLKSKPLPKKYDIAIILSGPEPQRSYFEEIILNQLKKYEKEVIVVRGKVDSENEYALNENVIVKNYCLSQELNRIINQSDLIISRSGYSSIMDMAKLGKKAIFVPTPGQTEQEYLAKFLKDKKHFYSMQQKDFDLVKALEESKNYFGLMLETDLNEILLDVL